MIKAAAFQWQHLTSYKDFKQEAEEITIIESPG